MTGGTPQNLVILDFEKMPFHHSGGTLIARAPASWLSFL
jgi:hypothetical protein